MLREHFQMRIDNLREDLLQLGSMVELSLTRAMRSLERWDPVIALQVVQDDRQIDEIWHIVEERTVSLLATEQPVVASDLRLMAVVLVIAGELERIGDYASIIARRVRLMLSYPQRVTVPPLLFTMASHARMMLRTSLDSFLMQDVSLARSLTEQARKTADYEQRLRNELIELARTNPQQLESVLALLEIVHAISRVSDRSTNIGERVIYFTTSVIEELN